MKGADRKVFGTDEAICSFGVQTVGMISWVKTENKRAYLAL